MNKFFLIAALSLTFVACEKHDKSSKTTNPEQNQRIFPSDIDEDVEEDLDGKIKTVQNNETPANQTPQQTEKTDDRTITQKIRRAITSDNSLSLNAKNIKIIAINGVITLRGPVDSKAEIESILKKVHSVQGVTKVNSQLVATQNH
jgi:osmotically-inducible protein OsmY